MALFQDQYQGKTKTATLHTGLLAEVAELVDALDSKSSDGNIMGVRFPPSAPEYKPRVISQTLMSALSLYPGIFRTDSHSAPMARRHDDLVQQLVATSF